MTNRFDTMENGFIIGQMLTETDWGDCSAGDIETVILMEFQRTVDKLIVDFKKKREVKKNGSTGNCALNRRV